MRKTTILLTLAFTFTFFSASLALAHGHGHLMGTVAAVTADRLEVKTKDGKAVSVPLTAETKYFQGDKQAARSDVRVGGRVVVHLAAGGAAAEVRLSSATAKPGEHKAAGPGRSAASLQRVTDVKKVCMVNDRVLGVDQIPVQVEGRTYYGCCPACKETLAKNATTRYSTDPVSGARVDKATAIIGARPDGTTLYFESEGNLKKYSPKTRG